jgi:hypothetical protein
LAYLLYGDVVAHSYVCCFFLLLLQTKTLQCAAELVGVHAVELVIEVVASGGFAFHTLASYAEHATATHELTLTFWELAAEVTRDQSKNVFVPALPCDIASMWRQVHVAAGACGGR